MSNSKRKNSIYNWGTIAVSLSLITVAISTFNDIPSWLFYTLIGLAMFNLIMVIAMLRK